MRAGPARTLAEIFDDENIGACIARIRKSQARESQSTFAARFGLTRDQLAFIETGRTPAFAAFVWQVLKTFNHHPAWIRYGQVQKIPPPLDLMPARNVEFIEHTLKRRGNLLFRDLLWCLSANLDEDANMELTHDSLKGNSEGVKSELDKLIARVKRLAKRPGAKAELARVLDVAPARVSEWLSDDLSKRKEPGGHYALLLLKWASEQEH